MPWLVAITKPQNEVWAAQNAERQDCHTYLPRFQETTVVRGKKLDRIRCLFPRYLFVETPDLRWRFLLGTFGLVGVVLKGDEPAVMPVEEIERMKAKENKLGLIVLPPRPKDPGFTKGQRVRVLYGPLIGYEGVCQQDSAGERVKILLDFLGRKSSVLVTRSHLQALPQ